MKQLDIDFSLNPTGPKEWLLSQCSFRRELRCCVGLEVPAWRLLHGLPLPPGDSGWLVCRAIEGLVEDGWLEPLRHAPYMQHAPILHQSFCSGDGCDRIHRETWETKRTRATQWVFRVLKAPPRNPPTEQQLRSAEWFRTRGVYVHIS